MKHAASLAVLVACTGLGLTSALGQDRPDSRLDRQDQQELRGDQQQGQRSRQEFRDDQQQGQRSGLTRSRVRDFYDRMEENLRQAANNQNNQQAAQFLRRHLSEDAAYVTTNTLFINGRQVATSVMTLDDDAYSALLGFAANATQGGGRRNVQNYQLDIEVLSIDQTRNPDIARVNTVVRESGQIRSAGQDSRAEISPQARNEQGQRDSQRQSQADEPQRSRDQQRSEDSSMAPRGSGGRGLTADRVRFQTTTRCEQLLRLGNDNQINIGNTQCRSNMEVER